MRQTLFGLFVALVVGTPAAWPNEPRTFSPPAPEVFHALGAQPTDCPESRTHRFDDHIAVHCAATAEPFKSIKKRWRKTVRRGALADFVQWDGSPWRKAAETEYFVYAFLQGTPVAITFDDTDGTLTVNWPESYPGCHRGYEVTWWAETEDVLSPTTRDVVRPIFPEEARAQRSGGAVMGSSLVDSNGRVVDVCVAGVYPPNVGFEKASIDAQAGTTYEPATRDGEPVAIATTFSHTFWVNVEGTYASALLRNYFDSVRRDE